MNSLEVAILVAMVCIIIGNKVIKKYLIKDLEVTRRFPRKILEVDENVFMELIIENRKRLPISFLRIEEMLPNIIKFKGKANYHETPGFIMHNVNMMIKGNYKIIKKYSISFKHRGNYDFKESRARIIVGDYLGTSFLEKSVPEYSTDLVIAPKAYDIENNLIPFGDYNGEISVKRFIIEDPILTIGLREYTGAEPQKHIHWPSSLKSGRLMVKQFDYTCETKASVIVNLEVTKPVPMVFDNKQKEDMEKVISISRSVADLLEQKGVPYLISANTKTSGEFTQNIMDICGWGNQHFDSVLEYLGRLTYDLKYSFENYLQEIMKNDMSQSTVILIIPYLFQSYLEQIEMLRNNCKTLIIISLSEDNLELLHKSIVPFYEGAWLK